MTNATSCSNMTLLVTSIDATEGDCRRTASIHYKMAANLSEELLNNNSQEEVDYFDDDYFDIGERAEQFLSKPAMILSIIVGAVAAIVNILTIFALLQVRLRLTSRFRLLISLAVSDALICISALLAILIKILNPLYYPGTGPADVRLRSRCIFVVVKALNTTGLNISLLNLLGMAVDHYIAIMRPLHYPRLMSRSRANLMIVGLWIMAFISGFSGLLHGAFIYPRLHDRNIYNYCEIVFISKYQEEYTLFAITLLGLVLMVYMYVRIYVKVHRRAHMSLSEHLRQDFRRTKRALVTTMLILVTFMLCWLPGCLFQVVLLIQVFLKAPGLEASLRALYEADQYIYLLWLLNAMCDPVIYMVRMTEVRCGYWRLMRRCCVPPCPWPGRGRSPSTSAVHSTLVEKKVSVELGRMSESLTKDGERHKRHSSLNSKLSYKSSVKCHPIMETDGNKKDTIVISELVNSEECNVQNSTCGNQQGQTSSKQLNIISNPRELHRGSNSYMDSQSVDCGGPDRRGNKTDEDCGPKDAPKLTSVGSNCVKDVSSGDTSSYPCVPS